VDIKISVFWRCLAFIATVMAVVRPVSGFGHDLIAFGDSLTAGCYYQYEQDWCGQQPITTNAYSYIKYLEVFFHDDGQAATVKNFGVGGEQTSEGVNRIDSVLAEVCNQCVDYFLLFEGTNDLLHHKDESVIYYNLGLMIDKVRARGIQPILATLPPDPDHTWKPIGRMNDYIRQLAVEKDVELVDLYNVLGGSWPWYTYPRGCYEDRTHPNEIGFYDMAGAWYNILYNLPLLTGTNKTYFTSAKVYGSVDSSRNSVADLVFQYGEDCAMDKLAFPPHVLIENGKVLIEARISGLKPSTLYYYRLIATKNVNGETVVINGGTKTFITTSEPNLPWLMLLLNNRSSQADIF
jgi:lysophospholipase L1-like esterase